MYAAPEMKRERWGVIGPGGDRLFRRLSGSTMGAEGFHGRVRDGIGCLAPRYGHQAQRVMCPKGDVGEAEVSVGVLGACPCESRGLTLHAGGGAVPMAGTGELSRSSD